MTDAGSDKYALAARMTVNMVVEVLAARHAWSANEALSHLSKTRLYEALEDLQTKLWMDNPLDIADLFDKEYTGQPLTANDFTK
jgi:hypothetical protein